METKNYGPRLISLFAYYRVYSDLGPIYGRLTWRLSFENFRSVAKNITDLKNGKWVEKGLPEICKKYCTKESNVSFCSEEEYCFGKACLRTDENKFKYSSCTIPTIADICYLYRINDGKIQRYIKQIDINSIDEKFLDELENLEADQNSVVCEIYKDKHKPQGFRFIDFPLDYTECIFKGDILLNDSLAEEEIIN